jgi:hypothetical protein
MQYHSSILPKRFTSITYDNIQKVAFIAKRDGNMIIEFVPSNEGLYCYDSLKSIQRQRNISQQNAMVVETVEKIY